MRTAASEARDMLKKFYSLQEERVQTYKLFDKGHEAYLKAAPDYNFTMYRQMCHEITETFKKISTDIIEIKTALRDTHNAAAVAAFIDKVQEEEQKKLETTVELQLAKQNVLDELVAIEHAERASTLKLSLREITDRINEHLEELKYESEGLYDDVPSDT